LSVLVFGEKKPGDVPTRQLIIETFHMLFDLYPPTINRPTGSRNNSTPLTDNQSAALAKLSQMTLNDTPGGVDIVSAIRGLLQPSLPSPDDDLHDFMKAVHRPKEFKVWIGELADICRDYFW
jgi:hypothetical protein